MKNVTIDHSKKNMLASMGIGEQTEAINMACAKVTKDTMLDPIYSARLEKIIRASRQFTGEDENAPITDKEATLVTMTFLVTEARHKAMDMFTSLMSKMKE